MVIDEDVNIKFAKRFLLL